MRRGHRVSRLSLLMVDIAGGVIAMATKRSSRVPMAWLLSYTAAAAQSWF